MITSITTNCKQINRYYQLSNSHIINPLSFLYTIIIVLLSIFALTERPSQHFPPHFF